MQNFLQAIGNFFASLFKKSPPAQPQIPLTVSQPVPVVVVPPVDTPQPAPVSQPTPSPAEDAVASIVSLVNFVKGQPNPATCQNTIEARKLIKDVLGGGKRGDALQCTEYVSYRLKSKLGIDIQWPVSSGRNGGMWPKIFKTANMYRVLDEPEVNCSMSLTAGISSDPAVNAIGHVVFVEEVFTDGSIRISEANWPHDGIYNERVLPKTKWQNQYKAQFVSFQ